MKLNPTTPLLFYAKSGAYVPGEGQTSAWVKIVPDVLYAEWKGGFGDRALSAQAMGVSDMATVRTFYHPTIYAAMKAKQVVVLKNADLTAIVGGVPDKDNPNCYELWGGVDNVEESNQFMEFKVRRYEPK